MLEQVLKTMGITDFMYFLPILASICYNIIFFMVLVKRFKNIKHHTTKWYIMPLNIILVFFLAFTVYTLTLGSLIIDIAETDRERALLGNVVAIFKAYSVLLVVAPITQILIYNLALDFKFSKSKFTK
ncbi:TPA: hypothetical protein P6O31_002463 [Staphylococcus aureus]|uniref:hypothetical protein n=1 Tax=Staphylococcus TaxID=1279 RepID=UPI001889129F|nr:MULTISPECIES: hypothetical protein [Staphylococcus]HDP4173525.1 hypothetical protein [Staphylococcus aureus]MBF2777604.1 hypothetical protein [Staphylococcus saprophyticus]HDP4175983.1 hypothetical protein [Staphylococcus aureus]HDP4181218.1 hypothetical protein [Staphylococcus aureus]HDR2094554.1 hypothetical protein [Staphylococcus aureus]